MDKKLYPLTVDEKVVWAINKADSKQVRWNADFIALMKLRDYIHFIDVSHWLNHGFNTDPSLYGMIFGVCVYLDKSLGTGIAELVCEDGSITVDLLYSP